jgi:SAM-dependent methyltransferase
MSFDERDLYTGLATLHWAAYSETSTRWDQPFYKRVIKEGGGRALELGCGAGRLLLAYLAEGLLVDGVDISDEMLAVCRGKATALGLHPVLYEQPMQRLDLPHQYATIYIPCGSFVTVMDRPAALETLRRCLAHLLPGGRLAFNIYLPEYDYTGQNNPTTFPTPWTLRTEKQLGDGGRLVIHHRVTGLDPVEQIEQEERRYQLYKGETLLEAEIHHGQTRWYFRNEVLWMLQIAGFVDVTVTGDYTTEPFSAHHKQTMVFLATKPLDS